MWINGQVNIASGVECDQYQTDDEGNITKRVAFDAIGRNWWTTETNRTYATREEALAAAA